MHGIKKMFTLLFLSTACTTHSSTTKARISVASSSQDKYIQALNSPANGRLDQFLYSFIVANRETLKPENINAKNLHGQTILHMSIINTQNAPSVDHLLELKADVNLPDAEGNTALHLAVKQEVLNDKLIQKLLPFANFSLKDHDKKTAEDILIQRGSIKSTAALVMIRLEKSKPKTKEQTEEKSKQEEIK